MKNKQMTCVFDFDVRTLKINPHRVDTPFGQAVIVNDGNLATDADLFRETLERITDLEGREGMTDSIFAEKVLEMAHDALNTPDWVRVVSGKSPRWRRLPPTPSISHPLDATLSSPYMRPTRHGRRPAGY